LVKAAYIVAKEVDPTVTIVAGALASNGGAFIRECMDLGILDYCDVISFHGYGASNKAAFGAGSFKEYTVEFRAGMEKYNKFKPIWDTEASISVAEGLLGRISAENQLKGIITRQVAGITRFYLYSARDKYHPLDSDYRACLGFNDRPTIYQPLMAAYHRLLGDYKFEKIIIDDVKQGVFLYCFKNNDGQRILTGWSSQESMAWTQKMLPKGIILNQMGNKLGSFTDGKLQMTPQLRYFIAAENKKLEYFGYTHNQ